MAANLVSFSDSPAIDFVRLSCLILIMYIISQYVCCTLRTLVSRRHCPSN